MKNLESIKSLRQKIVSKQDYALNSPGVYRWWFKEEVLDWETFSRFTNNLNLQSRIIDSETYYALYFGMSKDMKERIKWHICNKHKPSAVKSGFLSTLRQSISALLGMPMSISESDVNKFMDDYCYLEWDYTETEQDAKNIEHTELTQHDYSYPLNIQGNITVSNMYLKDLKDLRSKFKK